MIGTSGSDLSHVLYIDKGSRDGIKVDMPVITPDGSWERSRKSFRVRAICCMISDQTSGAGVLLESLRIAWHSSRELAGPAADRQYDDGRPHQGGRARADQRRGWGLSPRSAGGCGGEDRAGSRSRRLCGGSGEARSKPGPVGRSPRNYRSDGPDAGSGAAGHCAKLGGGR